MITIMSDSVADQSDNKMQYNKIQTKCLGYT